MKFQCQNCCASWSVDELKEVKDIIERVMPGEPMPAGECPDCGALCHQTENAAPSTEPSQSPMSFGYFEVRPCIEEKPANHDQAEKGFVTSYTDLEEYEDALAAIDSSGKDYQTFWTLYGIATAPSPDFHAVAIGDFTDEKSAHAIMNAILAPMAAARDLIQEKGEAILPETNGVKIKAYVRAASDLDDVINQSSNAERI